MDKLPERSEKWGLEVTFSIAYLEEIKLHTISIHSS